MRKIYMKLVAMSLALILSITVVAMSSYAWFVLSDSPAVSGIQVAIGGGNTILIAPDVTQVVDGKTYHYPGYFGDTLNFSQYSSYDYLRELGGLTPVSTADGMNWYLPTYYDTTDSAVQLGQVPSGQLKDVSQFRLDDYLNYANLKATEQEKLAEGSYIYLDFWVVSPGSNYTLRVSTGDDTGGSFMIDLLEPVLRGAEGTDYVLTRAEGLSAAACARVGFLVSPDRVTDNTMEYYMQTNAYDSRYTQLRGWYQDENGEPVYGSSRFTIYEPNADVHPNVPAMNGSYVVTNPVAKVAGVASEVDISGQLTVQTAAQWASALTGTGSAIEQRFQAAILGMNLANMTPEEISDSFYNNYLQGQIAPYVQTGSFIKNTSDLYKYSGIVDAEQLAQLDTAGATEDVYIIELERNVPQRIRMFIWLEGQDMDCVNGLSTGSFALNIELAGSNLDE